MSLHIDVGHDHAKEPQQHFAVGFEEQQPDDADFFRHVLQPREIPRPRTARSLRFATRRRRRGKRGEVTSRSC